MDILVAPLAPIEKHYGSKPGNSQIEAFESADYDLRKIEKVIKKALLHLPCLTTVAVVEMATGMCIAHHSSLRSFDSAVVAACHTEMVRQKQQVMMALNMRGERLEDILIPFRKQLHLIRLAKNGKWFVYLAVKAQDSTLALAREVLKSIVA
jgi:hypothetical protein